MFKKRKHATTIWDLETDLYVQNMGHLCLNEVPKSVTVSQRLLSGEII